MTKTFAGILVTAALILIGLGATAQTRVIDGDTLRLNGQTVRLLNIDAPELGQTCQGTRGQTYACGEVAANALRTIVASGKLSCTGRQRDQYDRLLAHCSVDGRDIGAAMVLGGHALAFERYSDEYTDQQTDAFKAGRGLWAGSFVKPWDFRAARWSNASDTAVRQDCPIKGNINADGERIYHTPYSRHYGRTRISTSKGERWFCSEAEALAAGWRAPFF